MTRPEVRTLRDAAPLAALAHPFRSRIMDALKVDGPSTASMLASRTGRPSGTRATTSRSSPRRGSSRRPPSWPATGASAGGGW